MPADRLRPVADILADALEAKIGRRPQKEKRFHKYRRWRIDLCYARQKLAVEIDGQTHLTFPRQRDDAEKRNSLTEAGWTVLSYPARSILTKKRLPRIVDQIARVLTGVEDQIENASILTGD